MKNLFSLSRWMFLVVTFTLFWSCSKNDDPSPVIQSPSVSYSSTTLNATSFQASTSPVRSLNWNGDQGNFSLGSTLTGLNINSTTGVLNWTNELPIGTHMVQVIAANSAGQTVVTITINNRLEGTFTGVYNDVNFFELDFFPNGNFHLRTNDENNPETATGTWTITNNTVIANFIFDDSPSLYSISGDFSIGTTVTYSGYVFNGYNALPANQRATFTTTLN